MSDAAKVTRRAVLGGSVATSAAALIGSEAAAAAGQVDAASQIMQTTQTVQDTEASLYTADNTSFGTASTGGGYADCAVVFTAPSTGRVMVHWSGAPRNVASGPRPVAYLSPEVRSGGTIGSGGVVLPAHDRRSVRSNLEGTQTVRAGSAHLLSGLTPGATYNARILHRVTSRSAEFFQRTLIVAPAS